MLPSRITVIRKEDRKNSYDFLVHLSGKPEEHQIEPSFYKDWSIAHTVPVGAHYEIELMNPERFTQHKHTKMLHLHLSKKTNKYYICWTEPIKNTDELKQVLKIWSLGTFYTLLNGKDFAPFFTQHDKETRDGDWFERFMKHEHHLSVWSCEFNFH